MSRLEGGGSEVDDPDVWTVDRLLDGSLSGPEVPDGYDEVASLIGLIREGVAPAVSGWGSQTVPAMAHIITAPPRRHRRRRGLSPARLSHAAAVVGVFAALGSGTAAAAANGSLPAPVQTVVHSAAATIGVRIPEATQAGRPIAPPTPRSGSGAPHTVLSEKAGPAFPTGTAGGQTSPGSTPLGTTDSTSSGASGQRVGITTPWSRNAPPASQAAEPPPQSVVPSTSVPGANSDDGDGSAPSAVQPSTTPPTVAPPTTTPGGGAQHGKNPGNGHSGSSQNAGGHAPSS